MLSVIVIVIVKVLVATMMSYTGVIQGEGEPSLIEGDATTD